MKKDRTCSTPYPIYPPYAGVMPGIPQSGMMPGVVAGPGMMMPQSTMMNTMSPNMMSDNTIEQQMNSIEQRINNLDSRITALENKYSTNYNSSNYQML